MVPDGSPRLALRRMTPSDVDLLVELDSDPEVLRYLSRVPPTRPETEALVASLVAAYSSHPRWGRWLAFERTGGAFVGWFALTYDGISCCQRGQLDLGYRLRRPFWGQGLASEMCRLLIPYAFEDPSIERVYAQTMAVNERSRRVLAAVGLTHVRTFHPTFDDPLPGTELGEVEYELRPRRAPVPVHLA